MIASHNTDIGLSFYNDRVKEIIDADIIAEPFTYVPPLAGHMELVGGNALVFGKITEGYDVVELNVETELTYEDVSQVKPTLNFAVNYHEVSFSLVGTTEIPLYDEDEAYVKDDIVKTVNPVDQNTNVTEFWKCKTTTTGNIPRESPDYWEFMYGSTRPHNSDVTFKKYDGLVVIQFGNIPLSTGQVYCITVVNAEESIVNTTFLYEVQDGDTWLEVRAGLIADMIGRGFDYTEVVTNPEVAPLFIFPRTKYYMNTPFSEVTDGVKTVYKYFTFNAYILNYGNTVVAPSLKNGASHQYGFVYKDRAGRVCSVIKRDSLNKYIPFYAEDENNLIGSVPKLTFKIHHIPPIWAESYEIVYFGNVSMNYWQQLRASNIQSIAGGSGNRFSLSIQDTLSWIWDHNNRWKVPAYVWEDGDRVRLVGTLDDSSGEMTILYSGEAIGADYLSKTYDYEIEATGTQYNEEAIGGDWLIFQAIDRPTLFEDQTNIIVEVYRPNKGLSQMVAYGTGMVFGIGVDTEGNRYHKGDVDQNFIETDSIFISPAEVVNTANDCWKYFRLNYKQDTAIIQSFWAESMFPSDWWSNQSLLTKLTSMGFPFLDDLSQRQTVLDERMRHGGYLITGTRTNDIAHFTFDDFMDFPKKNGDITGLREVGFTLKVIQMYKETSVYINRIQTFNPDGTEQFTLTDKFLAEQRPVETDYGCQHPDSVMVNGRSIYYWDSTQGVLMRSSPNGQAVLDIKMKRWFKDLLQWIKANGGNSKLEVRIGANNDHNEIWATWRMGDDVRGLIFNEVSNRFIAEIDQPTESYIQLGSFFAHLYRQCVWVMNIDEGQDFLSWSGSEVYGEVEVVSNIEPNKNKIFNAVAVIADHLLQSLQKTVVIPEEASAVGEMMESNIPILERKEGVYFGKIMKDENSKGNFLTLLARKLNGREMRGRYCFVKFRTEEHTEKVRVDSIVVFSTPSERNV